MEAGEVASSVDRSESPKSSLNLSLHLTVFPNPSKIAPTVRLHRHPILSLARFEIHNPNIPKFLDYLDRQGRKVRRALTYYISEKYKFSYFSL